MNIEDKYYEILRPYVSSSDCDEVIDKLLNLHSVSGSYLPKCNRVEVIDKSGRAYTNYDCKSVETQMQDEERTLKVFIS